MQSGRRFGQVGARHQRYDDNSGLKWTKGSILATPARSTRRAPAGADRLDRPALRRLAELVAAHAPHDGCFPLRAPGAYAIRRSRVTTEMARVTLKPMLCVVAQGAKVAMLGREVLEYHAKRMLVFSVELPIVSQIVRASATEPFLCFRLDLDPFKIAEVSLRVFPNGVPRPQNIRGAYVTDSSDEIVDATSRLLELMSRPVEADLLGPLVIDEILVRLLLGPVGSRVAQIGHADSGVRRIAKAVSEIRSNFAQPLKTEALARLVHMSVSSFHQHFKAVTSMSPLQYQKVLRLQEARRLMLVQPLDARSAAREVGYLSASQFSREYARYFGSAPVRDIARLREKGTASRRARR